MADDGDQYCYDPVFLKQWQAPKEMVSRLPDRFTTPIESWQASGAAVLTAMARLEKLENTAVHRGWPEKTHAHLSRQTSTNTPSTTDCTSPPASLGTMSPANGSIDTVSPRDTFNGFPPLQTTISYGSVSSNYSIPDLATPPETPEYSKQYQSPLFAPTAMLRLNTELAPYQRRDSLNSPITTPQFDEAAWDVYINSFEAEVSQLQSETMVRFRHMRHAVDKLWIDTQGDTEQTMDPATSAEFVAWWNDMGEQSRALEQEVQKLAAPELERVKLERASMGLSV
ncbi:hypothetical protein M8818_005638 [Zalaria obscura]|uniref:Uncharacterized protein n=1 Tax=Zalaria obscura TaxID=2024903 RepID=A0ACC3SAC8_9PEZI